MRKFRDLDYRIEVYILKTFGIHVIIFTMSVMNGIKREIIKLKEIKIKDLILVQGVI